MGEYENFLITLLYEGSLLRCALQVRRDCLPKDWDENPSREYLHSLLPLHVQSCGPIVEVEEIFEIV